MKKRWKRKGGKVIAAAADWQAPPCYRKLDDVREALELWAGSQKPVDKVAREADLRRLISWLKTSIDLLIAVGDESRAATAHDDLIAAENELAMMAPARRHAQ